MKTLVITGFASALALHASVASAAINYGSGNVQSGLKGTEEAAPAAVQTLVGRFMTFLAIIALLYLLWGGFNILTAGGDEEKVKKGKTVIIQACIGLVVIYLANSFVQFILGEILGAS